MPEQSVRPISQELADAFRGAVLGFPDCEFGNAPVLFRGLREPASGICATTILYSDPLPPDVFAALCEHMRHGHHHDHKLKAALANEPTYSMAARCLLQLIERHKRQDRLLQQMLRRRG